MSVANVILLASQGCFACFVPAMGWVYLVRDGAVLPFRIWAIGAEGRSTCDEVLSD